MKRKLLVVAVLLSSWTVANAQGVIEAHQFSQTDLRGTARSMSMGGAFGALGGDISAVAINPAGIGVYKSSEIVATLDFQNVETKTNFQPFDTGTFKDKKFKVGFNNFGFVGTFPIYSDVAPLINFGFSYNKLKSFDRKYTMSGSELNSSLTDYMADRANGANEGKGTPLGLINFTGMSQGGRDVVWKGQDWLPVLGYNSGLITHLGNDKYISSMDFQNGTALPLNNDLFVTEKGSINTYDFNMGTTFEDMISAGLTISVTDIDYKMASSYYEEFFGNSGAIQRTGGYGLHNEMRTEGTGWQLGLGVIFKPINELRIGLAYHSPTWYQMTDDYYADLSFDLSGLNGIPNLAGAGNFKDGEWQSMDGDMWSRTEYKLRTPDKWTFSLAGVIGANAIISFDYDLIDYKKAKFSDRDGRDLDQYLNGDIKAAYRLASTIRVGGEYRFTPQFSGRVGYSWQQNPYSADFSKYINTDNPADEVKDMFFNTAGSVTHYVIDGDTNYITWGLGYKFTKNIYTDLAFVYKTQKADLYTYVLSDRTKLKQTSLQGALTLGFRF